MFGAEAVVIGPGLLVLIVVIVLIVLLLRR
jgi:hypothetical protein